MATALSAALLERRDSEAGAPTSIERQLRRACTTAGLHLPRDSPITNRKCKLTMKYSGKMVLSLGFSSDESGGRSFDGCDFC